MINKPGSPRRGYSVAAGFSLLELMITIAVFGILAAVAFPSFRQLLANNRLTQRANNVLTSINTGRAEAIKLGKVVRISPATCGSITDWANGAYVWVDLNGNSSADTGEVLNGSITAAADDCATAAMITTTASASSLQIAPSGTVATGAALSVTLCDKAKLVPKGRSLSVALSGRTSIDRSVTCT